MSTGEHTVTSGDEPSDVPVDLGGQPTDVTTLTLDGFVIKRTDLVTRALTHRSYVEESDDGSSDYQRLEFLGDAVLGMIVTVALFRTHTVSAEGPMSRLKSVLVSTESLAQCARKLGLGDHVRLGRGEHEGGGRDRSKLLADVFEAMVGAIYVDSGYAAAESFVMHSLRDRVALREPEDRYSDYKSELQTRIQSEHRVHPRYATVRSEGPAHEPTFWVEVSVHGEVLGLGKGGTRKAAEQDAAKAALLAIEAST